MIVRYNPPVIRRGAQTVNNAKSVLVSIARPLTEYAQGESVVLRFGTTRRLVNVGHLSEQS